MANPFLTYLKNIFASQRIIGDDKMLNGLAKVDGLLHGLINEKRVPGLSITVLKDGKRLFEKGYGYADVADKKYICPKETIFRVASVSKPIAATALAHIVADRIMTLDASFYEYVPYFPKKQWDFTIRQLASHTAGIRKYKGKEFALNKPYSIKESIALFKEDPLLFEPGTGYEYTSFDWVLLSLAMQEASGIPFEAYVWNKVLQPLEMKYTFSPDLRNPDENVLEDTTIKKTAIPPELKRNLATCYTKVRLGFREAVPVHNFYKLAGGGYLSTSEDIAKLGQAYLEGYPLDKTLINEFLTSVMIVDRPTYYGLGWQVSQDKMGRAYYGHIGSSVGAYSNFFVYPEEQMVFSILINCTDPNVQDVLDEVVQELLGLHKVG
ncbi:serine hydrolase domain-containing protein [Maribacter chungangensis]|uniref:Serine hydrolase domain-containing protein n=1 Tax=Maribacter chungangensis TaxID=1069117 RepID=A0ABW3B7L2_9FLAO